MGQGNCVVAIRAGRGLRNAKECSFPVRCRQHAARQRPCVRRHLQRYLERGAGHERQRRYLTIFEQLRAELAHADYLGALQHYRGTYPRDPHLLTVSQFLIGYPSANRLYPNSLDAAEYVKQFGKPVILSDGDVVFQPQEIRRSGPRSEKYLRGMERVFDSALQQIARKHSHQ